MPPIDHTWFVKPPHVPTHVSCGGVVVRVEGGVALVALVREGPRTGYVLPKGHLEAGETLEQAARREILEEAGLENITLIEKLGALERLDYFKTAWKVIHYFLFSASGMGGKPTDPNRDYIVNWFPLDDLPPMFWPEQRALLQTKRERILTQIKN